MVTIARANLLAIQRSISALGVDLFSPNYFAFFTVGVQISLDVRHCLSQCGNVYNLALKRVGHTTNVIHATTHPYLTSRVTYTVSLVIVLWIITLRLCPLVVPVYTKMPLNCHRLTQCTLGYHWVTSAYLQGTLEKLSWNCPTLECQWRHPDYCSLHWNTNGGT